MSDKQKPQMSLAELERLHQAGQVEEIVAAQQAGRLDTLLGRRPDHED